MPRPYREPGDAPESDDVFVAVAPAPDTPGWLRDALADLHDGPGGATESNGEAQPET